MGSTNQDFPTDNASQIKGEKYEEQACYNLLYQGRQYVFFHLQPSQKCGIGRALDLASNLHLDLWFARSKVHQEMAPPLRPKVSKRTKRLTCMTSFIFMLSIPFCLCVEFLENRHGRSKETPVPCPSKAPERTDSQGVPEAKTEKRTPRRAWIQWR